MGREAYRQILAEQGVVRDPEIVEPVRRIGRRLAAASGTDDRAWEFNVIPDDTPNAFALPGGYVGVHTGMLRVADSDDELAAVMAHEIGHVIARHPAERLSRQAVVETGLGALVGGGSQPTAELLATAATLGLVLPFSRSQESEADAIGLRLMAEAGYDPRAAISLWRKLERAGGPGVPDFLSTHPAPGDRIAHLESLMPQALEIYEARRS